LTESNFHIAIVRVLLHVSISTSTIVIIDNYYYSELLTIVISI